MKINNWRFHFIYGVVILCYAVFTNKVLIFLDNKASSTYYILPLMIWSAVLLIILGIPSLYFALGVFLTFSNITFVTATLCVPVMFFLTGRTAFIQMFQVILGYIVITSFVKVNG